MTSVVQIPMSAPALGDDERAAVQQVLDSSALSIGPRVLAFEAALAGYIGAANAVAVSSGTSGLHLCMIAAGVEAGDLVITTPFSFVASANCVLYERGVPLFVDVDPATGNLAPQQVAEACADLQEGGAAAERWLPPLLRGARRPAGRLRVLLPVHVFGQPADMNPICETARSHDLIVVEDACEAIGAEYKGRKAGTLGDAAVFAFYPNKQITTGEGGMIAGHSIAWDGLLRSLRNQGRDTFDSWLNHSRLGYNYRLDEMSAALGVVQLQRIEELLARREQVARWYEQRLAGLPDLVLPQIASTTTRMSWFVYVVRIMPPASRSVVMTRLATLGIPSRPYFSPIHLQPFYRQRFGYRRGAYPIAEELAERSLALPFSSLMAEEQVDYVCAQLRASLDCR